MIAQKFAKKGPMSEMVRHSKEPKRVDIESCVRRGGVRRLYTKAGNGRSRDHQDASAQDEMRSSVWAGRRLIARIVAKLTKNLVAMKKHGKSKTVRALDVKAAVKAAYGICIVGGEVKRVKKAD